jgi:hypothetical protein
MYKFFGTLYIQGARVEMGADTRVDLHVKCRVLFFDFNRNRDVSTKFNQNLQQQNLRKLARRISNCHTRRIGLMW